MTRHDSSKKKRTKIAEPILTEQQKEEQKMEQLLQLYSPERRDSMREQIRQRKHKGSGTTRKKKRND
jgi:hypothetical protein